MEIYLNTMTCACTGTGTILSLHCGRTLYGNQTSSKVCNTNGPKLSQLISLILKRAKLMLENHNKLCSISTLANSCQERITKNVIDEAIIYPCMESELALKEGENGKKIAALSPLTTPTQVVLKKLQKQIGWNHPSKKTKTEGKDDSKCCPAQREQ